VWTLVVNQWFKGGAGNYHSDSASFAVERLFRPGARARADQKLELERRRK